MKGMQMPMSWGRRVRGSAILSVPPVFRADNEFKQHEQHGSPEMHSALNFGRYFQEDLCLMTVAEDGALRFVSGAVLFPQRWSLAEKLGMDMRWASCPLFNYLFSFPSGGR